MTDIDRSIAALHAVKLIRDMYASSSRSAELVEGILTTLEAGDDDRALRKHVAAAIRAGLAHQALPAA